MCCIYLNLIKYTCPKINLWQIYKGVEMRTNGYTTRIINVFEYLCDSCVHQILSLDQKIFTSFIKCFRFR